MSGTLSLGDQRADDTSYEKPGSHDTSETQMTPKCRSEDEVDTAEVQADLTQIVAAWP